MQVMHSVFRPMARALSQIDDPAFMGVLLRSVLLSGVTFLMLALVSAWGVRHVLPHEAGWSWVAGLLGGLGAGFAALWLFLPLAVVIAALLMEPVARAVDRRFYPDLPIPRGAPLVDQFWDGMALGLRVLVLNGVAFLLAVLLPGIGLVLGWGIAAWALGRGLFVAVAMRRMDRPQAQALYASRWLSVLAQGAVLAAAATVPLLNLLVPVIGTAAMVHVLHDDRP